MTTARAHVNATPHRNLFLGGVFLIAFAVLVFQIVQTRILSVIAWYYLAFFAISVAMLGMTAGAVWVYLRRQHLTPDMFSTTLSDASLLTAVAMPASVLVQFCLITTVLPSLTSALSWALLMGAMTVPYFFAGIAVSLALTRSPFPVSLVYAVDLVGAALGCAAVIGVLEVLDGPTAILFAAFIAGAAAWAFARGATASERAAAAAQPAWRRPTFTMMALALLIPLNMSVPAGFTPIMVKDSFEGAWRTRTERWNSYSRIVAYPPSTELPFLWGPAPTMPMDIRVPQASLNIDGSAGTMMHHYDGTRASIDFLKYDLVNLAYHLPGIEKSAVIGVGGGRDLLAAHLFGVPDVTGVELNRIFIDLHTTHPVFAPYSNLTSVPGVTLRVDDARSWFAATRESFDLIQMSMIDTWAATGAGGFSLSENGLYTLEGWRAFTSRLRPGGVFTVSRWYNPGDVNETGRMIALALGTMMDAGVGEPRRHVFVARASLIATMVLSKDPLSAEQLATLRGATQRLGFEILIDPDLEPESGVLRGMVHARNRAELDAVSDTTSLDLTVPTDNRPFFFNQLRFSDIPQLVVRTLRQPLQTGVLRGNLTASITLVLILVIALVAVICTILLPLRRAAASAPRALITAGTAYFALIGLGFMFAEISMLQFFSIFLGHPIYSMGVCLFSLILATGLGSLTSERWPLNTGTRIIVWSLLIAGYLMATQAGVTSLFEATTSQPLPVRIAISLAVVMPAGFLMGFAFPTGMTLISRIDPEPTPWFWGINGATGVLASVLAVMVSMAFGIDVTMALAGTCYLLIIPAARQLLRLSEVSAEAGRRGLQPVADRLPGSPLAVKRDTTTIRR